MKKEELESSWSNMGKLRLDELDKLKQEAAKKIRWARHAFSPKQSMNLVSSDPRFKKIFSRTKGYTIDKFKDVENGNFGKKLKGFKEFVTGIAEFYNVHFHIFIDKDIEEVQFQKMIRDRWMMNIAENQKKDQSSDSENESFRFCLADWGNAPDISFFYGRDYELNLLDQWINDDLCRMVAVSGMGGIGKTRLAVKFAADQLNSESHTEKFDYIIWRSLINVPAIDEILYDWISFFSDDKDVNIPSDLNKKQMLLLKLLQSNRCLMILDNVETILESGGRAGRFKQEHENFKTLFCQIGETNHRSCLIITGRERFKEIDRMSGIKRNVRKLELTGLTETDGAQMFQDTGLSIGSPEEFKKLVDMYKGNPLALELVVRHIDEVFFGSVSEFLIAGNSVFDDITDLLEQHFRRFSDTEKEILYWLAVNREAMTISELRNDILSPVLKDSLPSDIQSLQRRLPVEKQKNSFTLQPVLIEFFSEKFIRCVCDEIRDNRINLFNKHSIVKAVSKDYIRKAQIRIIADQIIKRVSQKNSDITNSLRHILDFIRTDPSMSYGYAGGNILNLLCRMEENLSEYDFSQTSLWQAYLKGKQAQGVDFSDVKFRNAVFTQHFGSILSITFSMDRKYLAIADTKSEIRIIQVDDGHTTIRIKGIYNWIRDIAFNSDGRFIAGCGEDKNVRLWDVNTGQCLFELEGHTDRVQSLAFSSDSQLLATGSYDNTVKIWDVKNALCLHTLTAHTAPVYAVEFSPDGKTLATAGEDRLLRLWDVSTGDCLQNLIGHEDRIRAIAFSPDGRLIASGGDDLTIRLWSTDTHKKVGILKGHNDRIRTLAFNFDNETLASSGEEKKILLWNLKMNTCIGVLKGHSNRIRSLVFSQDKKTLFSGGDDQAIRKWDISKGVCLNCFTGYMNFIRSVQFSPDGKTLISCSQDGVVRVWDTSRGDIMEKFAMDGHWPLSALLIKNEYIPVSTGKDFKIRLWLPRIGQCFKTFTGHESWVRNVAADSDKKFIVSCSDDHTLKIWETDSAKCIHTLKEHSNRVCAVAINPAGKIIASGGYDNIVKIWDIDSGRCLLTLEGHEGRICSVSFAPGNKTLATSSADQTIRIWNYRTGQCMQALKGHQNWIRAVAFSPDSSIVASGSEDRTIGIWDIKTGRRIKILKGHENWIMSLAFSPAGNILASSSVDETIKIWNFETGECINTFRPPRPYEGMNISNTTGLTEAQKDTLKELGAVDGKE